MYMLNMVIILIVMYCNVVTAIDKIPTYLLRFNNGVLVAESGGGCDHPKPPRAEFFLHPVVSIQALPLLECSGLSPALLVSSRLNRVHPFQGELLACLSR